MLQPADKVSPFPEDFVWGVATSAFQIEGAAADDGKGPSIWDDFCRRPGAIADGSNGDIACDHYHRLEADLDLIASLGVDAYRFSVVLAARAARVGTAPGTRAGLDFYDRLVDGLLARGIKPYLTLNHWDLPQALQASGGWAHARHRAPLRRLRLRHGTRGWATGWPPSPPTTSPGSSPPGPRDRRLRARAEEPRAGDAGRRTTCCSATAWRCRRCARRAARRGWASCSTCRRRRPPPTARPTRPRRGSKTAGWCAGTWTRCSRAATPTTCWSTWAPTRRASRPATWRTSPRRWTSWASTTTPATWPAPARPSTPATAACGVTDMGWEIYPQGLTELLLRLHRDYPVPPMYVKENGAAFKDTLVDGRVHDVQRTDYIAGHIAAVGEALRQGVRMAGYMVWSLLDNFEWASGYDKRFGIVHVDYATQRAHAEGQRAVVPRVPARPARAAPAAAGQWQPESEMGQVSLRDIRKSYGAVDVIKGIDLDVSDGEFLVFVGPSGCGKSTVLRMIAGLESVTGGELLIDGERANDLRPADRGAAMVFQSYALYPHMTVAENMGFALKMAGVGKAERSAAGRPRRRDPAHHRAAGPLPEGALGRPAPARGHRPRHRAQAQGLPVRRAAVQPRRRAAREHAHRAVAAAQGAGHDHDLRHPRPGRGHDHGRPHRRVQPGPCRAARRADGAVPAGRPTSSSPASSARRASTWSPRPAADGAAAHRALWQQLAGGNSVGAHAHRPAPRTPAPAAGRRGRGGARWCWPSTWATPRSCTCASTASTSCCMPGSVPTRRQSRPASASAWPAMPLAALAFGVDGRLLH